MAKWREIYDYRVGDKYSRETVTAILAGLNDQVKTILRYHLSFDYAFMAGVYTGIVALCMMASEKITRAVGKKILLVLAGLQVVALACDIVENVYLLKWIRNPVFGGEFSMFHWIVLIKWIIVLAGAFFAIPLAVRKRNTM